MLDGIVGCRAGHAYQHALDEQRGNEQPEQPVAIATRAVNAILQGRDELRPIQTQPPAEEQVVPTGGDGLRQLLGRGHADSDYRDDHRRRQLEHKLNHVVENHAVHAADHAVRSGHEHDDNRAGMRLDIPRHEGLDEAADALEGEIQEAHDADQGIYHDAEIRQFRAEALAEAGPHPLGPREHVGAADPSAQVDHAEDHVEQRPNPEQPHALDAVDEEHGHEPHRAADVQTAGTVGDADDPPGHALVSQEVGLGVLGRLARDPPADGQHQQHIQHDDQNIDGVHASAFLSPGCAGLCRPEQACAVPAMIGSCFAGTAQACSGLRFFPTPDMPAGAAAWPRSHRWPRRSIYRHRRSRPSTSPRQPPRRRENKLPDRTRRFHTRSRPA